MIDLENKLALRIGECKMHWGQAFLKEKIMIHDNIVNEYLNNWTSIANQMQKPFKDLMELNTRTLQNMSYLKPEELQQIHKPEEFLDKQVNIFIKNCHVSLDFMQQAFQILENNLLSITRKANENIEKSKVKA